MESQWKGYGASTLGSVLALAEVILWPVYGFGEIVWLVRAGSALLALGATFIIVPILQLRRHGRVTSGENFTNTTALVDSGLYGVVRHPQYVGLLTSIAAIMLIVQAWAVVLVGAASIGLLMVDLRKVDADEGARFGDAYDAYMRRVPGWNPVAGVWRLARARSRRHDPAIHE